MKRVNEFVCDFQGDLFWSLNGVGAPDLVVVYVPEGCRVEGPLHLRYCSVEGAEGGSNVLPVSSPRVLVVVEKGGEVCIVEEYVGGDGEMCYWANSVTEVVVGEGAKVSHSYIQRQSLNAAHIKWTSVRQVKPFFFLTSLIFFMMVVSYYARDGLHVHISLMLFYICSWA